MDTNPIAAEFGVRERRLLQECIHCGFCLPTCPTYQINGKEMDSPRGRLYLMEAAVNNRVPLSDSFLEHIDLCLVCRACETACPSGVQFGELMETTRAAIASHERKSKWVSRFVMNNLIPSHRALSILLLPAWVYQHIGLQRLMMKAPLTYLTPAKLRFLNEMLTTVPARRFGRAHRREFRAVSRSRGKVALFTGCIMDHLFPNVHEATVRILTWNGYDVEVPGNQTCCGALHIHSGEKATAIRLARTNLSVFRDTLDAVVMNSAGCGAHLKNYERVVDDNSSQFTKKVKDLTEFFTTTGLRRPSKTLDLAVVYDDACHLLHGQGISREPRSLIESIPGVTLLPLEEAEHCCGSAGSYSITEMAMSLEILERKMKFIKASGADAVITANPGCQIQLAWGARRHQLDVEVLHIAELIDRAYSGDVGYLQKKRPVRDA